MEFIPEWMVKRVRADRQREDGDPVEIFFEFPEKKLPLPNASEAGSVFWISSPTP